MDKTLRTINYFVEKGREIQYLTLISERTGTRLEDVLNFSFDLYNYYIRENVEKRAAKVASLDVTTDYVLKLYNERNGECYDDNG